MAIGHNTYSKDVISKCIFREPNRTSKNLSYVQAQIVVTPFTSKSEVMDVIEPDIGEAIVSKNYDYEHMDFGGFSGTHFFQDHQNHMK